VPPQTLSLPRFTVAGVDVSALDFESTVNLALDVPRDGRRLRVHFAALHTFIEAASDPVVREALCEADIVAPDGMPIVWLGRLQGFRVERVCGPDVMPAVLDRGRAQGYRHFFYGGTPETLDALIENLTARYPGLQVAGAYAPPFRPLSFHEAEEVTRLINDCQPDYVWVGLGSPKQDLWLAEFRPLLHAPVLLAVGAAFDFAGGRRRRAPRWAQRWGLEWLFRLASEPRRLGWRYMTTTLGVARLLLTAPLRREAGTRTETANPREATI
jgi:N-acetylglucosaminyldiphosphoundecaprenol N-acetyl-beta-D-mannosaminyltransferase